MKKSLHPITGAAWLPKAGNFSGFICFVVCVAALLGMRDAASAQTGGTFTWNGGGGNGNWTTGGNWGGTAPANPQQVLHFAGSTETTNTNNFSTGSAGEDIYFNSGASSFTLDGNAINFYAYSSANPTIENDSSNTQIVNFQVDMESGNYTLDVNASSGNINLGASSGNGFNYYGDNGASDLALNANSGKTITVYGTINNGSGTPLVYVAGGGTVIYDGSNGYTGETDINAGTLELNWTGSGGAIKTSNAVYLGNGGTTGSVAEIALNTGTFANNFTINPGADNTKRIIAGLNTSGTVTYSGAITENTSGGSDFQLNAASGGTVAVTGQLTGYATGFNLYKTGAGTVILENANNNYTGTNSSALGATYINAGTLGIYTALDLGIVPNTPVNNINFTGNSTLQDSLNNITIGAGRNINIASSVTGTLDNGGNTFELDGIINGSGALTTVGSGTLKLTGASTYSGATNINAGTVIVSGSLSGTSGVTVASGANLEVDGSSNVSSATTVNGVNASGALQGTGKLGVITMNGGTLSPGLTVANATSACGTLNSGAVTLSSTTTYAIRLGYGGSAANNDELVCSTFSAGSATLSISFNYAALNSAGNVNQTWDIVQASNTITSGVFTGFANNTAVNIGGGFMAKVNYGVAANGSGTEFSGDYDVLTLTAIPEPGPSAGIFIGAVVLAGCSRLTFSRQSQSVYAGRGT